MVENALRELESGGFIAPTLEAASVWQQSKQAAKNLKSGVTSQFSHLWQPFVRPVPDVPVLRGSLSSAFSSLANPFCPLPRFLRYQVAGSTAKCPHGRGEHGTSRAARSQSLPFLVGRLGEDECAWAASPVCWDAICFSYDRYKAEAETEIGGFLKGPVKVGGISFQFFCPSLR